MKIGIVTITELDNFGNRLQNYALQTYLMNMGFEVETFHNYITYKYRKKISYKIKCILKGILKRNVEYWANVLKQNKFEIFDKKYINFSKYYSTKEYISPEIEKEYDYLVAGSDQIWNPDFTFNFDFNFMCNVNREKRVAYAASIGISEVPEKFREKFIMYINGIDNISVREYNGADIIEDLTGKKVQTVLDPTLLLEYQDWIQIEKKPKWIKDDKYILEYFLGSEKELKNIYNNLYQERPDFEGVKRININSKKLLKQFAISPQEFIWLIRNSKLVITDSFHGTVFSILLKTPFIHSFRRDDNFLMNSRIESLFKMLDIEYQKNIYDAHTKANRIESVLKVKRAEAEEFLKGALKVS